MSWLGVGSPLLRRRRPFVRSVREKDVVDASGGDGLVSRDCESVGLNDLQSGVIGGCERGCGGCVPVSGRGRRLPVAREPGCENQTSQWW